jgi:Co/Zn/Cd efflux system component
MSYFNDIIGVIGLLLVGIGVWQWSWPAALIVIGVVLIITAIFGALNVPRKDIKSTENE